LFGCWCYEDVLMMMEERGKWELGDEGRYLQTFSASMLFCTFPKTYVLNRSV
jgi:hypothetical protein